MLFDTVIVICRAWRCFTQLFCSHDLSQSLSSRAWLSSRALVSQCHFRLVEVASKAANTLWKTSRYSFGYNNCCPLRDTPGLAIHFILGSTLKRRTLCQRHCATQTLSAAPRCSWKTYHYYSLAKGRPYPALEKLPYSLKVLLENLLRNEDGGSVTKADIEALATAMTGQK